jgi:ubiquinol-cytochrome c reductase iron-sulfur subunit
MRWLVRLVFLTGALRRRPRPAGAPQEDHDPSRRELLSTPGIELGVAALLAGAGLAGAAFGVLIAVWPNTQVLGGAMGLALLLLAAALIVAGKRVVPQETEVEERSIASGESTQEETAELVDGARDGVSRRGLLAGAAGVAGVGLTAGAILPVTAIGPAVGGRIDTAPWRAGRAVVDERGRPISADDLEVGSFLTGFPEGADLRDVGSPVMVLHVDPSTLRLPAGRRDWAPEGYLAYSKICTHAGCAVNMLRDPLYPPGNPAPALVCPCHFSTFDVQRGAAVVFGPAGRPLPQVPLRIDGDRNLVAAGPMSGSVGPAWWGTKRRRA